MTNKERQASLDKQKWEASQEAGKDLSGEMPYCEFCKNNIFGSFCRNNQTEREKGNYCATAFNRMVRTKK